MRIFILTALITGFTLLGALIYTISSHPSRLETRIYETLQSAGVSNMDTVRFRQRRSALLVSNIDFDEKGFSTIRRLRIPYGWPYALGLKATNIELEDLSISAAISPEGHFYFTGWNFSKIFYALQKSGARKIILKDASIDLMTPDWGGVLLDINGEILLKQNKIHLAADVESTQAQLSLKARAQGQILTSDQWQISADILEGKIDRPHLKATRISGNANFVQAPAQDYQAQINLNAGSATAWGYSWQNVEAALNKEANGAPLLVTVNALASGEPDIAAGLSFTPGSRYNSLSGYLNISDVKTLNQFLSRGPLIPLKEVPEWLNTYRDIFIGFEGVADNKFQYNLSSQNSSLEASGDFKINSDGKINGTVTMPPKLFTSDIFNFKTTRSIKGRFLANPENSNLIEKIELPVTLKDGKYQRGTLNFQSINGVVFYNGFSKPYAVKSRLTFKLPLNVEQEGALSISHSWGETPKIHDLSLKMFGGDLTSSKISDTSALIQAINIDLQQLSKAVNLKAISLTGILGGKFELKEDGKKTILQKTVFNSRSDGIINYKPAAYPHFLQGNDLQIVALRRALENYHYDNFEVKVSGTLNQEWDVKFNAQGRNPDIFNGRPMAIDLSFTIDPYAVFANILAE